MDINQIKTRLQKDEGSKRFVYADTRGFWTIGNGFCVDEKVGSGLPEDVRDYWLEFLVNSTIQLLNKVLPQLNSLDDVRKQLFVCLLYNLGAQHLQSFHNMLGFAANGQFDSASDELVNSLWYKEVGVRGPIYARIMKTGVWE